MKRILYKTGWMLLLACVLTACKSNDETVVISETPKEQPEAKHELPKPESPQNNKSEDSQVVDMLPETRTIQLTQKQMAYAKKNNDFTFNLYRTIHKM